jgi:diacylglycerol kinase family enzyme/membrane-associated phospholipid phosphatase
MTFGAETRQRLLVGAAVSAIVVLTLLVLVTQQVSWLEAFDHDVGRPIAEWTAAHDGVRQVAEAVAIVTRPALCIVYAVVAALFLTTRGFRRPAVWLLVVLVVTTGITNILKPVVGRERPPYALMTLHDGAFPSGHSSNAAAWAGIAIVLATMFVRRRSQRRMVAVVGLSVAFLVGLDRLLLGVHHVSDVVAGWALGALVVAVLAVVFDPTPRPAEVAPLPTPVPSARALAVIVNPIKVEDAAAFRTIVETRAAELGWAAPVWYETTIEDPGRSMAHDAAVDGADLVLVCGGDGTVRTVCAELAGTGVPVGVIPAGTGNLLARNLDLPLYLNNAVEVALNGQDRAIDLVRISGDGIGEDEHFLVMAGMGFDAAIMEGATEQIKAKVGWFAYVISGLRNLMFPAIRIDISVDDGPFTRHRARTIVVGNVGFLQAGLPLLPDATLDDGRLDVVLINPARFLHWLLVVVRVITRGKKLDETVNRMTGRKVVIRASSEIPRQIDGDFIGLGHEITCECLHGKLLVRVPR